MGIERRRAPRIQTFLPVNMITGDKIEIPAIVSDISASGLGVVGDRSLVENLLPNTADATKFLPIMIDCQFEVTSHTGESVLIDVNCSVVYAQRSNGDQYKLGIQFADFRDSCEVDLAHYVLQISRTQPEV